MATALQSRYTVCMSAIAVTNAASRHAGRAQKCMHAACEHGALQFLYTTVLSSHCFSDEQSTQRQLYASTLHRLLIQFLNAARYVHHGMSIVSLMYSVKAIAHWAMPVSSLMDSMECREIA